MRNLILAALPVLVLACETYSDKGEAKANGRIAVSTSALTLPGVSDVCYTLEVRNGAGEVLWTQPDVCSSRYGNGGGGDIAYVGPCDASESQNQVSLTLTGMTDTNRAAITDFTNPCPTGDACKRTVTCVENADTAVDFNLTVMRDAKQGFFDVAVSIDDIACSAKFDCATDLLSDPKTGERQPTAVLGFACTGSRALHMSDIVLVCDRSNGPPVTITIDPSQGPGNYFTVSNQGSAPSGLRQVASWRTTTESSSSATWSVGIAPDLPALEAMSVTSCRLQAQATASDDTSEKWTAPETYPYIDWSIDLVTRSGNDLAMTCGSHAANAPGSGVQTKTVTGGHKPIGHVTIVK